MIFEAEKHELGVIICTHFIENDPLGFARHEIPIPELDYRIKGSLVDSGWSFGCRQEQEHTVDNLILVCMNCWLPRLEGIAPGFWKEWEDIPEGWEVIWDDGKYSMKIIQ